MASADAALGESREAPAAVRQLEGTRANGSAHTQRDVCSALAVAQLSNAIAKWLSNHWEFRSLYLFLSFVAVEHLLSIISSVYHEVCPLRQDPVESYLYAVAVQFFHVFPYSNWLAWLGKLLNVLLTFGWNYIDLFVILVSIGLSHLLTRLTRQLQQLVERVSPTRPFILKRHIFSPIGFAAHARELLDICSHALSVNCGAHL